MQKSACASNLVICTAPGTEMIELRLECASNRVPFQPAGRPSDLNPGPSIQPNLIFLAIRTLSVGTYYYDQPGKFCTARIYILYYTMI